MFNIERMHQKCMQKTVARGWVKMPSYRDDTVQHFYNTAPQLISPEAQHSIQNTSMQNEGYPPWFHSDIQSLWLPWELDYASTLLASLPFHPPECMLHCPLSSRMHALGSIFIKHCLCNPHPFYQSDSSVFAAFIISSVLVELCVCLLELLFTHPYRANLAGMQFSNLWCSCTQVGLPRCWRMWRGWVVKPKLYQTLEFWRSNWHFICGDCQISIIIECSIRSLSTT